MNKVYIRCDVCSTEFVVIAKKDTQAQRAAARLGWVVIDGKRHCHKCANKAQGVRK